MNGLEISEQFFHQVVLPLVDREWPQVAKRMSCGIFGCGSDAAGLDDEISKDHHWGPRTQILLPNRFHASDGERLADGLDRKLPKTFQGYPVLRVSQAASGVTVQSMDDFFKTFTGYTRAPKKLSGWFKCTEADLFHATNGAVWHDPTGELTRRRDEFAYWPEPIWMKKVADWCMFFTGRDAAYNVNRCYRREDWASAHIFLGQAIKRAMELGFLLNKTYAPYTKWLHRLFVRLPLLSKQVEPHLQTAMHHEDWHKKVMALVSICRIYARHLHKSGLTPKPTFKRFDPSLTDLVLYESTTSLLSQVPEELRNGKFNETEHWEQMARDVLFDSSDYFQKRLDD